MDSISGVIFAGFYVFSILSICWWIYLAYAHEGVGAYQFLSDQTTSSFFNHTVPSAIKKQFEIVSILVCFTIFLYALCDGLSFYFSWIPDQYHLTLGDGSALHLSTILSCLIGICASIVFGRWIFIGICSHWENRALVKQSDIYFEVIRHADNIDELHRLRDETLLKINQLKAKHPFTPGLVYSRLELSAKVIQLRIEDIQTKN